MPRHITDAGYSKDQDTDHPQTVTRRNRLPPGSALPASADHRSEVECGVGKVTGIQDRVPRSEKRLNVDVVVRPAVREQSAEQPRGEGRYLQIEIPGHGVWGAFFHPKDPYR